MDHGNHRYFRRFPRLYRIFSVILCVLIAGCSFPPILPDNNPAAPTITPAPDTSAPSGLMAEYTFKVKVPAETLPDVDVFLNILDEITGLALNPTIHKMQPVGNLQYELKTPFPVGSVVKYRYTYQGTPPVAELNGYGKPVRYRLASINTPGEVTDTVTAWEGLFYDGPTGRITGVVTDQSSQQGIPDLLITAGGESTFTGSDGSFLFENLPPGTHNLVAYSIDGAYTTFQQGAVVATGSTTPAVLTVAPTAKVDVQFIVTIPQENIVNLPVRLAGTLYPTGNTFADLSGGISTIASRMPLLTQMSDGRYSITLSLPVGADFQYKYTLGDGFWNSEHTTSGPFRLRSFVVPDHDIIVDDIVMTWRSGNVGPIAIEVKVPSDTPTEDYVSLQFNPYTWMEPLPMWSLGDNRWLYVLYSPMDLMGNFTYRFCRNNQCGVTDDVASSGPAATGATIQPGPDPQTIQVEVSAWAGLNSAISPATNSSTSDVFARVDGFTGGFELQPGYHPSWQSRFPVLFSRMHLSGANMVVLTPTWTFTNVSPPVIEPVAGYDALWADNISQIAQAAGQGLNVAIFPAIRLNSPSEEWWQAAPKDPRWWEAFFTRYQAFILHNADLAAKGGAQSLILGGPWLMPAMPNGILADGSPSNSPADTETRWRDLIAQVRGRFSGKILWAISHPGQEQNSPAFLDAVDEVYVLWSATLVNQAEPVIDELTIDFANQMDSIIYPIVSDIGKPVILAITYPSIDGAATDCVGTAELGCAQMEVFNQPNPAVDGLAFDFQEQADLYQATLEAINQRDWISGVVSRGYYPPASMQDKSLSVHGKPAADVLSYWLTGWLSPSTQ